jgi:hypothetical protein
MGVRFFFCFFGMIRDECACVCLGCCYTGFFMGDNCMMGVCVWCGWFCLFFCKG